MGGKIKPRQQRNENGKWDAPKRRSLVIRDMITRGGAGKHTPHQEKRAKNPKRQDWDSFEE